MGAKTSWWFCGKCGFKNHPRLQSDSTVCEQCGHASQPNPLPVAAAEVAFLANDTDYLPGH